MTQAPYNRTPAYWVVFVRKVITIDLREIKGIPNTAKVVKTVAKKMEKPCTVGGKGRFYVHTCQDTERVFICERGVDNNIAEIAEVFARNDNETVGDNAIFIANALNLFLAQGKW